MLLCDVGSGTVVGAGELEDVCAHKEQYPGVSQQSTANRFFHLLGKPFR
jgi:hypothetical protein